MDVNFPKVWAVVLLLFVGIISWVAGRSFLAMHEDEQLVKGPGVTEVHKLSEYNENLKGSPGDTNIFVMEGKQTGGTALIVGGAHPNEPAGFLAPIVMIENGIVKRGRVIIIPRANHSGFTHSEPLEGSPRFFTFNTSDGKRRFRLGSRLTNPIHQWPDPSTYISKASQKLAGFEVRNLNRTYPGSMDGYLTEKIAKAIITLIKKEKVNISIDLHESSPEYPVTNAIVAHQDATGYAIQVKLGLELKGLDMRIEESPRNFRGLSHREWGDHTSTKAILVETPNPSQGKLRGKTNAELIVTGEDKYYEEANKEGVLYAEYGTSGWPIEERVGRHLAVIKEYLKVYSNDKIGKAITLTNLPEYTDLLEKGLGGFL